MRSEEGREREVRRRPREIKSGGPREGGPQGQTGCNDPGSALRFSLEPHPCGRHPPLATPPPVLPFL